MYYILHLCKPWRSKREGESAISLNKKCLQTLKRKSLKKIWRWQVWLPEDSGVWDANAIASTNHLSDGKPKSGFDWLTFKFCVAAGIWHLSRILGLRASRGIAGYLIAPYFCSLWSKDVLRPWGGSSVVVWSGCETISKAVDYIGAVLRNGWITYMLPVIGRHPMDEEVVVPI